MDDSKFLIIGANGQLGKALQAHYPNAQAVDYTELDITNCEAVNAYDWSGITHILNAAAYTNVDGAETPDGRKACWSVNAVGVANLTRIANQHSITIVHISSEYVFDGSNKVHTEDEVFTPLSVYGATKAAGDISVSLADKHYILRISWLIGEGKNFVRTMMNLAERDICPTVVSDQIGRLTFTSELVRAIDHLLSTDQPFGTYNLSNEGESASWADITREIFKNLGRDDLTVTDTTTAEYFASRENIAPRPLQSTLNLSKIQSTGFTSTDWRKDLIKYIESQ